MQLSTILSVTTLLFPVALAAIPSAVSTKTTVTNVTITPPHEYYLKTKVIGADCPDKDGLYVSGYHTGAGTNDIVLTSIEIASVGFLNGTYQQFDYNTSFPWGLEMGDDDNYAAWEFANIDSTDGIGSGEFYFNASGLQWNTDEEGFAGWLACDWWHGLPQLFWSYVFYNYTLPSSCVQIELQPVAI
ncbi:hypothetical protein P7C71_g5489, partial [Lecanoromycetidae sp. Uapishka_2]